MNQVFVSKYGAQLRTNRVCNGQIADPFTHKAIVALCVGDVRCGVQWLLGRWVCEMIIHPDPRAVLEVWLLQVVQLAEVIDDLCVCRIWGQTIYFDRILSCTDDGGVAGLS